MKAASGQDLLDTFRPGQRVFFQGGPGECIAFFNLLKTNPEPAKGVEFWSCLIPGINTHDYGSLPGEVRLTTFMASPAIEPSLATGRTQVMAMPHSEIGALLAEMEFDTAVLHTSSPDGQGQLSFGLSCDMPSLVWPNAKRRAAFVNARMPNLPGADAIPADAVDLAIALDAPLLSAPPARRNPTVDAIAARAAALIPNGATIQSGIGDTPAAIAAALYLHRGLRVHSGIITSEYQLLADSGALDPTAEHVTGIAWGDLNFQSWLPKSGFLFRSALETHALDKLAKLEGFVSIGSALEVDLSGNLNLEWRAGHRISSVGGAPDYLRGAAAAPGGRSIIALQATSGAGASRIVPHLDSPSIAGALVDIVITEHGVAELRGLDADGRADALVALAAPRHREALKAARAAQLR